MGKSSAKRSMHAQARALVRAQGDGENQVQKGQCAHRRAHRVMGKSSAKRSMHTQARAHRVMGKSSAKRSMRAQARAQGDGEIKCKKGQCAHRHAHWCAHRCAHRVMGKSSAKRSMCAQAAHTGARTNVCTG